MNIYHHNINDLSLDADIQLDITCTYKYPLYLSFYITVCLGINNKKTPDQ